MLQTFRCDHDHSVAGLVGTHVEHCFLEVVRHTPSKANRSTQSKRATSGSLEFLEFLEFCDKLDFLDIDGYNRTRTRNITQNNIAPQNVF